MKKMIAALLALAMAAGLMGCTAQSSSVPDSSLAPSSAASEVEQDSGATEQTDTDTVFQIAGLKGPTTMGMVKLASDFEAGQSRYDYQVTMYGTADEIVPKLVSGEVDVAAIPANLAATLYARTEGQIQVAVVNTLGVLYLLDTGDSIHSMADLAGKTIYTTGKGTTPEYVLRYLLTENGLDPDQDVTIEFKSEATEVAALMQQAGDQEIIAMLPQPYVTVLCAQLENVRVALDMTEEWDKVSDSGLITGVLVARRDFIEANSDAFDLFLQDYAASTQYVNENIEQAAQLVADFGIIEKAAVAQKAIPACNITYIDGEQMKQDVAGYLQVLYEQAPDSVGGSLPGDDFYYDANA